MPNKNQQLLKALNWIIIVLTALQVYIPNMPPLSKDPLVNASYYKILSAVLIFLVPVFTAWKQKASTMINNHMIWASVGVIVVAAAGGIADLMNKIPAMGLADQWIRSIITLGALIINFISKGVAPSELRKQQLEVEDINSQKKT